MAIHLTEQARQDVTIGKGTIYLDSDTGELNVAGRTTPHIIPGVLYPAVSGNDLSGTALGGSYVYGTAHTDGRKYYYTDIKGSKPIKDPRIGGHFGSQRHTFSSLQILEQETATHGKDVYSVDGREWLRVVNNATNAIKGFNDNHGSSLYLDGTIANASDSFIEIVGYFNDINFSVRTTANRVDDIDAYVNGGAATAVNHIGGRATVSSPLQSRYVRAGSSINIGSTVSALLGTTSQINTLKIVYTNVGSEYGHFYSIELIAQDTSNRNNIQIPSQNVVSYGKKFTISGTPHYDPFNGFVNGTSLHSDFVDTATSLGLDTAPGSSAKWAISSTNHIRPYQGGRVVKWVDSDGTIKTSVNMMTPNAQNLSTTADSETTTPSATNTNYKPAFSDDAVDHTQSEVAKTFHFREFGNGSANGNASYKDVSTLSNSTTNVAYVMDDGTTSYSGESYADSNGEGMWPAVTNQSSDYLTFIGTGITIENDKYNPQTITIAQNLPYGTHILKSNYTSSTSSIWTIDGVSVLTNVQNPIFSKISIYQPKRPPIPEDACVIADYMLMADWVNSDSGAIGTIPKGAREVSPSRDLFYDSDGSLEHFYSGNYSSGWFFGDAGTEATINTNFAELPVFGTRFHVIGYDMDTRSDLYVDGSIATSSGTTGGNHSTYLRLTNPESNLGIHKFRVANKANGRVTFGNFFVDSPIHTSHHYQSFETPFLHELIGGDRNMEQTNLVCSPDGKTWDQITRDTSYIGNLVLSASNDSDTFAWDSYVILTDWRGKGSTLYNFHNKYFAIAYDRVICLKDGVYDMFTGGRFDGTQEIEINGTSTLLASSSHHSGLRFSMPLKRGDYIKVRGDWSTADHRYSRFTIHKIS